MDDGQVAAAGFKGVSLKGYYLRAPEEMQKLNQIKKQNQLSSDVKKSKIVRSNQHLASVPNLNVIEPD